MGTLTTNYNFNKPTIGADLDSWGADFDPADDPVVDNSPGLNGNWEKLDALFNDMQQQINAIVQATYIRVGGMFLTDEIFADGAAVATALGYGTWIAHATGRAIVGVGASGTSVNRTWNPGELSGLEEHTLITGEMPSHDHGPGNLETDNDTHNHGYVDKHVDSSGSGLEGGSDKDQDQTTNRTTDNDTHKHNVVNGRTGNTGGGLPHNNVQPSIAIHVWKRVA